MWLQSSCEAVFRRCFLASRNRNWLTDEVITIATKALRCPSGAAIPESIAILPAGLVNLMVNARAADVPAQIAGLQGVHNHTEGLANRQLVIAPINDSRNRRAGDAGGHWTLLVAWKHGSGWHCIHLDSLAGGATSGNHRNAAKMAERLFGRNTTVHIVECSRQQNGYDCGVFVIHFSEIIIRAFCAAARSAAFHVDVLWRRRLREVERGVIDGKRKLITRLFQEAVEAGVGRGLRQPDTVVAKNGSAARGPLRGRSPVRVAQGAAHRSPGPKGRKGARAGEGRAARKAPPLGRVGSNPGSAGTRGSSSPKEWSVPYSHTSEGGKRDKKRGNRLRSLKQDPYDAIRDLSEEDSKAKCKELGFCPPMPDEVERTCPRCKGVMVLRGAELCCKKRGCCHFNAERAFTPLFNTMTTWNEYLRLQYVHSAELRVDQSHLITGIDIERVGRVYGCIRDMKGWFAVYSSKDVIFDSGEVDIDVSKSHVARSGDENRHKGRVLILRERASDKELVIPLPDIVVQKGDALPPESLGDVVEIVENAMRCGSIGGVDGGKALESAIKKAAGGSVPRSVAVHSKKPRKQFTALHKLPASNLRKDLLSVMQRQGRLQPGSSSVRTIGGNQKAEGAWGTGKSSQKSRCVHRGGAHQHASAHATACLFMSRHPGLVAAGRATAAFIRAHLDRCHPRDLFSARGWTGAGVADNGELTLRVANIGLEPSEADVKKRPASSVVQKRPASSVVKNRPASSVVKKRPLSCNVKKRLIVKRRLIVKT